MGDMPNVIAGFILYLVFLHQVLNDSDFGPGYDSSKQRKMFAIWWWVSFLIYGISWWQFYTSS